MMAAHTVEEQPFVSRNESLAAHTSWRVGGTADIFCEPQTVAQLREFLRELPRSTSLLWIGYGSNLLVRDGGVRGAVVSTARMERELERVNETHVRAGAGLACARLAKQCEQWQLGPAAFMVGIPGTIGGALAMNAGAFGGETWSHVDSVQTVDRSGNVHERPRSDYHIAYRTVVGPADEWFLAATFAFEDTSDAAPETGSIRSLLGRRADTQPVGQASCGSVFRNPEGNFAGALIESAGLKGASIGGAVISDKHANFIVNDGSASAADIEALIAHVREQVLANTGIELQPEVRIVGEVSDAHES